MSTPTTDNDFVEILEPPFNHLDADIIVRSTTSRVDFPVIKAFLMFVSPLWHDMFSIGKGSENEMKGTRPVVPFQEDKETLGMLLALCYPLAAGWQRPRITNMPVAGRVCEAARRRCADGVERLVMDQVMSTFLNTKPLSVFAFAWHFGMKEEVKIAAKLTLGTPLDESTYMEELEWISAGTYHRLKDYHTRCWRAADQLTFRLPRTFTWIECSECYREGSVYVGIAGQFQMYRCSQWWMDFRQGLSEAFRKRPCLETMQAQKLMTVAMAQASEDCSTCRQRGAKNLKEYTEQLAAEFEKVMNRVKLEVPF